MNYRNLTIVNTSGLSRNSFQAMDVNACEFSTNVDDIYDDHKYCLKTNCLLFNSSMNKHVKFLANKVEGAYDLNSLQKLPKHERH